MFPMWMFHASKGKRLFASPDALDKAGAGWHESPADVGMEFSAPANVPGGMIGTKTGVEQPQDASVASEQELAEIEARKASRVPRPPVAPKTPDALRRAVAPQPR